MHRYDIGSFCAGTPISISARFAPEIRLDIGSFCAKTPIYGFPHTCLSRFIGLAARDGPIWYRIVFFIGSRCADIHIGLIGSRCADIDIGLSAYWLEMRQHDIGLLAHRLVIVVAASWQNTTWCNKRPAWRADNVEMHIYQAEHHTNCKDAVICMPWTLLKIRLGEELVLCV